MPIIRLNFWVIVTCHSDLGFAPALSSTANAGASIAMRRRALGALSQVIRYDLPPRRGAASSVARGSRNALRSRSSRTLARPGDAGRSTALLPRFSRVMLAETPVKIARERDRSMFLATYPAPHSRGERCVRSVSVENPTRRYV